MGLPRKLGGLVTARNDEVVAGVEKAELDVVEPCDGVVTGAPKSVPNPTEPVAVEPCDDVPKTELVAFDLCDDVIIEDPKMGPNPAELVAVEPCDDVTAGAPKTGPNPTELVTVGPCNGVVTGPPRPAGVPEAGPRPTVGKPELVAVELCDDVTAAASKSVPNPAELAAAQPLTGAPKARLNITGLVSMRVYDEDVPGVPETLAVTGPAVMGPCDDVITGLPKMLAATGLVVIGLHDDVVMGPPKTPAALAMELSDEVVTGVPEKLPAGAPEPKNAPEFPVVAWCTLLPIFPGWQFPKMVGVAFEAPPRNVPGVADVPKGVLFSAAPNRRDGRWVGANGLKTEEAGWLAVPNTPAAILLPYLRSAE